MGYRLTPEEVAGLQSHVQGARFVGEALSIDFTTTHEFLSSVLPPCFTVPEKPTGVIQFDAAVGATMDFTSVTVWVSAMYGDIAGRYDLTYVHTGDMSVTFGRELWGEAKKSGEVEFNRDLPKVSGTASRGGKKLITATAELGDDLGPRDSVLTQLHLKAFPNHDATELEWDPIVFALTATTHYETYYEGEGTIDLLGSSADPCHEIPIESFDRWSFSRFSSTYEHAQYQVEGKDGYLPYVVGRSYDLAG